MESLVDHDGVLCFSTDSSVEIAHQLTKSVETLEGEYRSYLQIRNATDPQKDAYFRTSVLDNLRILRAVLIAKGQSKHEWHKYDWDNAAQLLLTPEELKASSRSQGEQMSSRIEEAREEARQTAIREYNPASCDNLSLIHI